MNPKFKDTVLYRRMILLINRVSSIEYLGKCALLMDT